MKTSVEATGKNIEQAIENALFELKAPRDDVDIKIVTEGGLFKKAKVVVSISEDCLDKYTKRQEIKAQSEEEIKVEEENKNDFVEEKAESTIQKTSDKTNTEELESAEETTKEEKPEKVQKTKEEKIEAVDFIKGLLTAFGKDGEVSVIEEEEVTKIEVTGENLSELIGYRGETLFALSYLMTTICKRGKKRQILDICRYRDKRAESLKALAKRMADKVAKTGRYAKLEPMDASERRQIHLALQDNEKVTTMSKGTEPKRYLIIFPREYKD